MTTFEVYPDDYRRVREAVQTAQIPGPEFCALAIHKGVKVLTDCRVDVSALLHSPNVGAMK